MTLKNTTYNLGYPLYGAKFVNENVLVVTGGGGRDQPGLRSKLTALKIDFTKKKIVKRFREITLDSSDDSPTTLDAAKDVILLGCNEGADKIAETGVNHHIRKYVYQNDHLQFTASIDFDGSADSDIYTKLTAISPNGAAAAIASSVVPTLIRVINPVDLCQKYEIQTGRDVRDLAFSLDGQLLAYVTPTGLDVASIASGEFVIKKADFEKNLIFSKIRFISNDTVLIAATFTEKPGGVLLKVKFNKTAGKIILKRQISDRLGSITAFEVDTKNEFAVLATNENAVAIFKISDLSGIESFRNLHELLITRIAISPDSKLIATVSAGNTVNVISKTNGSMGSFLSLIKKILINLVLVVAVAALTNIAYKNNLHLKSYEFAKRKYLERRDTGNDVIPDVIEPWDNLVTTTNIIQDDIVSISSYTSYEPQEKFSINIDDFVTPSTTLHTPIISISSPSTEPSSISTIATVASSTSLPLDEILETYSFDRHLEMPTFNEEELSMMKENSAHGVSKSIKDAIEPKVSMIESITVSSTSTEVVTTETTSSSLKTEKEISSQSIISSLTTKAAISSEIAVSSSMTDEEISIHSRTELKPASKKGSVTISNAKESVPINDISTERPKTRITVPQGINEEETETNRLPISSDNDPLFNSISLTSSSTISIVSEKSGTSELRHSHSQSKVLPTVSFDETSESLNLESSLSLPSSPSSPSPSSPSPSPSSPSPSSPSPSSPSPSPPSPPSPSPSSPSSVSSSSSLLHLESKDIKVVEELTSSVVPPQTSINALSSYVPSSSAKTISDSASVVPSVVQTLIPSVKSETKYTSSTTSIAPSALPSQVIEQGKEAVEPNTISTTPLLSKTEKFKSTSSMIMSLPPSSSITDLSTVSVEQEKETISPSTFSSSEKAIKQKITIDGVVYVVASTEDESTETTVSTESTHITVNPTTSVATDETTKFQVSSAVLSDPIMSQNKLTDEKSILTFNSVNIEDTQKLEDNSVSTSLDNTELEPMPADSKPNSESKSKMKRNTSFPESFPEPSISFTNTGITVTKIAKTVVEETIEVEIGDIKKVPNSQIEESRESQLSYPVEVSQVFSHSSDNAGEVNSAPIVTSAPILNAQLASSETAYIDTTVEYDASSDIMAYKELETSSAVGSEPSIEHDEL
ncbi:similar to Saccharomyces cerevisiae YCR067C SED4 Integral endoplasmic reticulum membrane protein that stimulates Sar1p GTPase activity [Maudiozyma saulgeensis]|uniref:Guanine nucleotide-exchange factor SEC12 n=1 Tax=Maudiozyma saulgeensis TaxID=1789683 RepID=A0A1X7R4S3_9SACH|nr:similar to Saccharomyces cerevisiae YCR067C SED4 Integral endoplasmic reticulum membrane protein that stimulates Sar1p GTPase activity [Kazachstania saulgeensis]